MFIVLGATGHIGSNLVRLLDREGGKVLAVVHSARKGNEIETANVQAVVMDVMDKGGLRGVFQQGKRAFLLNPPANVSGETNSTELRTAQAITEALVGSGLEKIVVASTYGAQEGDAIGDLSVLYAFERQAEASGIPTAINRSAYYYSNLDMLLEPARDGFLPTAFPAGMMMPMVSPVDIAQAAASRLLSPRDDAGIRYVEGPARYSFQDVADTMSAVLGRPVEVQTTPRDKWEESFRRAGFSAEAARSYARMTAATIDGGPEMPDRAIRGKVTLQDHVKALVEASHR